MSIFDIDTISPDTSAIKIRRRIRQCYRQMENVMIFCKDQVTIHGRAPIAEALGDDAAGMLSAYIALKTAVESEKEIEIDDLPTE